MKIAILGHKRIPSREGGIEVVVDELAVCMAELGHDVVVYNRNCGENCIKKYKNIRIVEIPTFQSSKLNAMVYSLLATFHIIFHHYDIVHYHAEGPCAMLPLAKLFGKRTVATIHGLDWQRAKWGGFATKYLKFGEKMAAKFADRLIVLSSSMQKYFLDTYHREGCRIPNGIQRMQQRDADIIHKYGIGNRDYILFLARLTPEKGLRYLVEAFADVKTDKKLIVAGRLRPSTPYIEEIQKIAAEDKRIQFIDFVQGEELAELYSNCYLYVLPSDIEGMPLSLLEAIGFRARVLVSDIPENTEFLNTYGHSFAKGNVASLREKLQYLLDNEKLYACDFKSEDTPVETERKIDEIAAQYDWAEIVQKTLDVYSEIDKKQ